MGALEIYLKIFMQKLWNILWPLFENKKMSKKIVIDQRGDEIEKLLSTQEGVDQKRKHMESPQFQVGIHSNIRE